MRERDKGTLLTCCSLAVLFFERFFFSFFFGGSVLRTGRGVDQDWSLAAMWFQKAAEAGDGAAACTVGKALLGAGCGAIQRSAVYAPRTIVF